MAAKKILSNPTTLFARVESDQYEQLRLLCLTTGKSIAEGTREALAMYLSANSEKTEGKTLEVQGAETVVVGRR